MAHDFEHGVALKRRPPGQQGEVRRTQRVDIAARIDGARVVALLGAHVKRSPDDVAGGGQVRVVFQRLDDAEVRQAHGPRRRKQDVVRLDVAMNQARGVRDFQRRAAVGHDASCDQPIVRPDAAYALTSALGIDELHHHVARAAVFADVVDGDDVGVAEPAGDLGFAHEALDGVGAIQERLGQELHSDRALQGQVLGFVDGGHAAAANAAQDAVLAENPPDANVIDRLQAGSSVG